MKRSIISVFLVLILAISGNIYGDTRGTTGTLYSPKVLSETNFKFNTLKNTEIRRIEIDGHHYLFADHDSHIAITHDPDCPCHKIRERKLLREIKKLLQEQNDIIIKKIIQYEKSNSNCSSN